MFFFLKLKGELPLTYESYAGGIVIVILIEILNDYLFYLALAGNNKPFRVTRLVDNTDTQYLGD